MNSEKISKEGMPSPKTTDEKVEKKEAEEKKFARFIVSLTELANDKSSLRKLYEAIKGTSFYDVRAGKWIWEETPMTQEELEKKLLEEHEKSKAYLFDEEMEGK